MKFSDFLLKEATYGFQKDFKEIKRECAYFLEASKGLPLYRGIKAKSLEGSIRFTEAPSGRTAKDSDAGFNWMFNSGFQLAYDFPHIREYSLFATGSPLQAHQYGPLFFVFPAGDFSFTYSPEYEDSWEEYSTMIQQLAGQFRYLSGFDMNLYTFSETLNTIADDLSVEHFLTKPDETVGVHIVRALAMELNEKQRNEIKAIGPAKLAKSLKEALRKLFAGDYIDNKDLARGIKLKHEMAIYDFPGYYTVPVALAHDLAVKQPGINQNEIQRMKEEGPVETYKHLLNIIEAS